MAQKRSPLQGSARGTLGERISMREADSEGFPARIFGSAAQQRDRQGFSVRRRFARLVSCHRLALCYAQWQGQRDSNTGLCRDS